MSARNNQANKAAARERLRVERERQAKKDRTRRQVIVALSVVGVLAVAGGVGYGVMQANQPSAWEAAKNEKKVVTPANSEGENGTTVVVGKKDAKKTLELYEDSRCPVCATFEQANGETIKKDVDAGKYRLKYIGATFIDRTIPGEGSRNALSALGAALDVGPEAFLEYKGALYAQKNHPAEQDDKFADDDYLLDVADEVDALKGNEKFRKNVQDGTFDAWALKMSAVFDESGVKGTPALRMDGRAVTGSDGKNPPMTAEEFKSAIDKALKG
ncbi:DsbA family protein [Streptomyces sp. NPDC054887]